ncbi:hypothetical protein CASFOL_001173 [Castilleja foliolosa]|uniref:Uncharacterized protein n=1 Tax=Castilleja foliolosa TaxID=1961234 RepID=A0ABD3ENQ6_9LAMI
MAYACLVSLKQTIQSFVNSSHVSVSPPSRKILDSVYNEAQVFQRVLEILDNDIRKNGLGHGRRQLSVLEAQMKEAACLLEDTLESHVLNLILSQSKPEVESIEDTRRHPFPIIPLDLMDLKRDADSFTRTVKEYIHYFDEHTKDDDDADADDDVTSRNDFGTKK